MLLDRRSRPLALQQFDIRGHVHRLNAPQVANPLPFTPAQEGSSRPRICCPRVPVADVDGEEFEEAQRGPIPCPCYERGKHDARSFRSQFGCEVHKPAPLMRVSLPSQLEPGTICARGLGNPRLKRIRHSVLNRLPSNAEYSTKKFSLWLRKLPSSSCGENVWPAFCTNLSTA